MSWFRRILSRGRRTRAAEGLKSDRLDVGEREAIEEKLVLRASLDENLETLRTMAGPSPDVVTRLLRVGDRNIRAVVVSIEGLVNTSLLEAIVRALEYEVLQTSLRSVSKRDALRELADRLLGLSRVFEMTTFNEVWEAMVRGGSVVMVDGTARALACSTPGPETRAVEEPENEPTIRGPREGFIEEVRTNTSILRRRIGTPNLWIEEFVLGRLTRTRVDMVYVKGLASEELVREVRQRVSRIEIDGTLESGYIEEFIDDSPLALFPLVLRTERPDRVASSVLEGRVAIITDNTLCSSSLSSS